MKVKSIFLSLMCITVFLKGREEEEATYVKKGNLALPPSQQFGPLFGFGEYIVEKGDLQTFILPSSLRGKNKEVTSILSSVLYGISDTLSLLINIPVLTKNRLGQCCSSGISDIFVQMEYAFYNKDATTYANQATIVGNMSFPTGSATKNPPTGLGSPSFFIGCTASHLAVDWYFHGSAGAILTTPYHHEKIGNTFLYQAGFGKNISYSPDRYIFSWMIEFDGIYSEHSVFSGIHRGRGSGGNSIFIGPSLWFSTQRLILQAGIEIPLYQRLFDKQDKAQYFIVFDVCWKFN
ncbi:MAG: hypothetical protein WA432_05155 [Candidatus Babeliaceae bacterium]